MQVMRVERTDDASGVKMAASLPLHAEEQARADLYALLARLLLAAPDAALLGRLAAADAICGEQSGHPLDLAWEKLVLAASVLDAAAAADEFAALFIGTGNPQLDPYGSMYLAGFLNEKPLAALRSDLAAMGLARATGAGEMEDHLGVLCETMRLMIAGGQGALRQPLERQRQFFETHIAPWQARCLADIRRADGANFYRLVADFAEAFFDVEAEAFELEET